MSSPRLERLRWLSWLQGPRWLSWLSWLKPARPLLLAGSGLWDLARRARHDDFAAWCRAHPGTRCALWIGSPWLTDLVCAPGLPLRDSAAQIEWARRVLVHYHGAAAGAWPLAAWRRRAARGVSALQGLELAALRQAAAAQRVLLGPVQPLWPRLLERLLAQRPALRRAPAARVLLVEGPGASPTAAPTFVTVLTLRRGVVTALHRRRLAEPQPASLRAIAAEDAAEHAVEHAAEDAAGSVLPTAVLLFDAPQLSKPGLHEPGLDIALDIAPAFDARLLARPAPAPDFQRPLPQPGPLAWAWCAASLLALGVAALEAGSAWQARAQAEALAVPLPAARRVQTAATVAPAAAAEALLRQRLAHPWRDVFLASETPAAAGVAWLVLEHQIGGDLRLQGLAADAGQVQRVATALRASPRWREVLVARLEVTPQGRSFEIVARPAGAQR